MICKKCGKEIKEDSIFCQYCGEKNVEDVFQNKPLYNTVPIWKIIILFIISFGLYAMVWSFNLWKQAQKGYGDKISPFWRSVFCSITNFELFRLINEYIKSAPNYGCDVLKNSDTSKLLDNIEVKPFNPVNYATIYIMCHVVDRILSNASSQSQDFAATDLFCFIPYLVILSIIVIIQIKINKINFIYNIPAKNDKWTWETTGFTILLLLIFIVYVIISASIPNS